MERKRPKYYIKHQSPDFIPSSASETGSSLYEALAYLLLGDFQAYGLIKEAVLHWCMRVRATTNHPLHDQYLQHEEAYQQYVGAAILTGLEMPDYTPNTDLFWTISTAQRIELSVYCSLSPGGEASNLLSVTGGPSARSFAVMINKPNHKAAASFAALVPDTSGKELVEFLIDSKQHVDKANQVLDPSALSIKRISWATSTQDSQVHCYNEFRPGALQQDLGHSKSFDRLDTFQVVVSDPRQVEPALKLLGNALARAPEQRRQIRVGKACHWGNMLPHVSADTEMVKIPREAVKGKSGLQIQRLTESGDVEQVVSVFTISVGSRLLIHFLPLHMLENATQHTVPALQQLFEHTVFDSERILLWWNSQNDMVAINNTIAHMYQGTPRTPYFHVPYGHSMIFTTIPRFHIKNEFLNGVRPLSLEFPRDHQDCELHLEGLSEQGFACPCRTSNIDIGPLLSHFCRQHGNEMPKLPWYMAREGIKFEQLLNTLLKNDRLSHILKDMKRAVDRSGLSSFEFYQSLGRPGMEQDDNIMGYLSGDGDVPVRIFESLLATNDADFIAGNLAGWANLPKGNLTAKSRSVPQRTSPLGIVGDIQLFEDNPRLHRYHAGPVFDARDSALTHFLSGNELSRTSSLEPWEHDRVVYMMRGIYGANTEDITLQNRFYDAPEAAKLSILVDAQMALARCLTDTTKLWVPDSCARILEVPNDNPAAVMRANQTTIEALIEHLQCHGHTANARPPPGFGAVPGSLFGVPTAIGRVPGRSLTAARDIFDAYRGHHAFKGTALGDVKSFWRSPPELKYAKHDLSGKRLIMDAVRMLNFPAGVYHTADIVGRTKFLIAGMIECEEQTNESLGRPSYVDWSNLVDPEGRDFRRRVEAAPEWNRPNLICKPAERPDGTWVSKATMMRDAREDL